MRCSQSSVRCRTGVGAQFDRNGLLDAFPADGRGLAVAGQDHRVVVQGEDACSRRDCCIRRGSPPGRSVRPIEPAKRVSPASSSCRHRSSVAVRNSHRPARMARSVVDGQAQAGEVELGRRRPVRAPRPVPRISSPAAEQRGALSLTPRSGSLEHGAVVRVDPGRDVVAVAHRRHGEGVVEVAVGEQYGDRASRCWRNGGHDRLDGVLTRVDDDAGLAGTGGQQVTVRLQGPGGEPDDQHETNLHDR